VLCLTTKDVFENFTKGAMARLLPPTGCGPGSRCSSHFRKLVCLVSSGDESSRADRDARPLQAQGEPRKCRGRFDWKQRAQNKKGVRSIFFLLLRIASSQPVPPWTGALSSYFFYTCKANEVDLASFWSFCWENLKLIYYCHRFIAVPERLLLYSTCWRRVRTWKSRAVMLFLMQWKHTWNVNSKFFCHLGYWFPDFSFLTKTYSA